VAIAGPPNAGKSTLLNRIARREAAIVSPYAGTTRDVIEVHLDLGGWPVTLVDTAGIRDTDDPVEMEGVRLARERAASADLVLWVVDASEEAAQPADLENAASVGTPKVVAEAVSGVERDRPAKALSGAAAEGGATKRLTGRGDGAHPAEPPIWLIRNKIDLIRGSGKNEPDDQHIGRSESNERTNSTLRDIGNKGLTGRSEYIFSTNEPEFAVSASTGTGFEPLFLALTGHAEQFLAGAEPALVTRERHRRTLEDALAALRRALAPDLAAREDLLAEELRIAARALGRLTGRVDVEDILDVIFRDFCIGK